VGSRLHGGMTVKRESGGGLRLSGFLTTVLVLMFQRDQPVTSIKISTSLAGYEIPPLACKKPSMRS
jgi:hypothetical protein